jgi:hypothetical protein
MSDINIYCRLPDDWQVWLQMAVSRIQFHQLRTKHIGNILKKKK